MRVLVAVLAGVAFAALGATLSAPKSHHEPRSTVVLVAAASSPDPAEPVSEDGRPTREETEQIRDSDIVANEPTIRDASVGDHLETDLDLVAEESMGTGGIADAPFDRPANNPLIGIAGGSGGSFRAIVSGGGRARGETTSRHRSNLSPHTVRLSVGDQATLPLERTEVSVRIEGFRARVEFEWTFRNDRDRRLEGTFDLRLPDGASPHALAFGMTRLEQPAFDGPVPVSAFSAAGADRRKQSWENSQEARIVPRESAAKAFAETERRRVDPALLEWTGAGVFHTRVFPLEAGRLHRIALAYDIDLVEDGCGFAYRLELPEASGDLDVRIEAAGAAVAFVPAGTGEGEGAARRWHHPKERVFDVRLPCLSSALLEGDESGTGPHFAAHVRPALPETPGRASARALFLLDVSGSANPDGFRTWLALLEQLLARNRPSLSEFAVAFFDVGTTWWRPGFTANSEANVAALLADARALALEGATDLGQALSAARSLPGDYDVFLLSDGAADWGEGDPQTLARLVDATHPLFAYRTATAGGDAPTLETLARESGGAVFSVATEEALAAAATAHRSRPWRLVGASWEGALDLLVAGRPSALFPGQSLRVVGRGTPVDGAPLRLTVEQGGVTRVVEATVLRRIPSGLATRAFGEVAVAQLEETGASVTTARAYAQHFRVVGRSCSLLLLESDAAYQRFGIDPDADAAAVRREPASGAVATALATAAEVRSDPKRRFLAWLERVEASGAAGLRLSDAVKEAIGHMPTASFAADAGPLAIRHLRADRLSEAYRQALSTRTLAYDQVWEEAERRRKAYGPADALHALGALVEQEPGDVVLARDVAFAAMEWGLYGPAQNLLRRVVDRRPHERTTWHEVAVALEGMGRVDLSLAFFEVALALDASDGTSGDFRRVVAYDYLRLLRRIARSDASTSVPDFAAERLADLAKEEPVREADLVVVLSWNTDRTDVDLHVTDPSSEEAYFSHPDTKIGGHLTRDVTRGFGPEMFVLPKAVPGTYDVKAHYFASDTLRMGVRSKAYVTLYEDWGRPTERTTRKTVTLTGAGSYMQIATLSR